MTTQQSGHSPQKQHISPSLSTPDKASPTKSTSSAASPADSLKSLANLDEEAQMCGLKLRQVREAHIHHNYTSG